MANFSRESTGVDVVKTFGKNVSGKTIVITGASAKGLGAQTAVDLAKAKPAQILLLARSATKVQPVIDEIAKVSSSVKASFIPISLDAVDSVRTAAAEISKQLTDGKIDILINNAGVMAVPYSKNSLGIESQFATNHIGHFVLTQKLMPFLKAAGKGSRVINLTSDGYRVCQFRPENINFDDGKSYNPMSGYGQSKTANILFTKGLARRGITSFAVHPGVIFGTGLADHLDMSIFGSLNEITKRNTGQDFVMGEPVTLEQGVATTIRAAIDSGLVGDSGSYLTACQVQDVSDYAKDEEMIENLWNLSEKLVGEKFEI